MPVFLVERYVPASDEAALPAMTAAAAAAASGLSALGRPVRYLWSTFLPEERTCLCLFDAPDRSAVEEANRRAGFAFDRIVEAIRIMPG